MHTILFTELVCLVQILCLQCAPACGRFALANSMLFAEDKKMFILFTHSGRQTCKIWCAFSGKLSFTDNDIFTICRNFFSLVDISSTFTNILYLTSCFIIYSARHPAFGLSLAIDVL